MGYFSVPVPRIIGTNRAARWLFFAGGCFQMVSTCLRRSLPFTFVLTALMAAGCGRSGSTDNAKEEPRVTVAHPVVRSLVDEDDYNGWLEASQTVDLRARVRGHIQKIYFKDGDMVQQGQLLFELDPRPFQVAVEEGEAQAKALEAQKSGRGQERGPHDGSGQGERRGSSEYEQIVADAHTFTARIAAKEQEVKQCKLDLEYSSITARSPAGSAGRCSPRATSSMPAGAIRC